MKPSSNLPSDSTFSASFTRRKFIKRTAGTVLLFGFGVSVAQAVTVGAWVNETCSGKQCQTQSVADMTGTLGMNGPEGNACTFAQDDGRADCTLYNKEDCANDEKAAGKSARKATVGGVKRWCVW